ncbi:MAG: HpcH/HpaI aldolase family protein [Chloroflexota bacterium]
MVTNRIKSMLAEGKVPIGHMVWEFKTRGMAALLAGAGCDFMLIDMEHSAFDINIVADLIAWARGSDLTVVVRVPDMEYHFIARCLDAGALGIMVPNVESVEEARLAADFLKYPPVGHRGVGLGHAHTGYTPPADPAAYMTEANAQTFLIAQIESGEGVANADAIAALDGVDSLWVGHFDLTTNLGFPGQFDRPEYADAIGKVVAACRKRGKAAGLQPGTPQQARWALAKGFNLLSYGADSVIYRRALAEGVATLKQMVAEGVG